MNKYLALIPALALAACGGPVVKDGDLKTKLESMGYSKVLIRQGKLNCGRFGTGKHFLGTKKDGTKVVGQICYKKVDGKVDYNVAINQVLGKGGPLVTPTPTPTATGTFKDIPNPWKKTN